MSDFFRVSVFFKGTSLLKALELDSLENSHPIEVEVATPDEVNEIFDAISYSKGIYLRFSSSTGRCFCNTHVSNAPWR